MCVCVCVCVCVYAVTNKECLKKFSFHVCVKRYCIHVLSSLWYTKGYMLSIQNLELQQLISSLLAFFAVAYN